MQCARWRVKPACNIFGTILPEKKISGHTPEFRELAISENGRRCLLVTSKAMACAALDLLHNPELLAAARKELAERLVGEQERERRAWCAYGAIWALPAAGRASFVRAVV